MILTPHMIIGVAIGSQSPNIWVAFCFGLISHYLIDILPHWDYLQGTDVALLSSNEKYKNKVKVALDLLIGGILVLILTWSLPNKIIIFVAVAAQLLPDFMNAIYMNYNIQWLKRHFMIHHKIHIFKNIPFWQGLPAPLIVIIIALYILLL